MALSLKNKMAWKIVKYGFLMHLAYLLILFIFSMLVHSEKPDLTAGNIFVTIILGFVSYVFAKRAMVKDQKEALLYGVSWAAVLVAFQLLITIPNQTVEVVFIPWTNYLVYVGIATGPLFNLRKTYASKI